MHDYSAENQTRGIIDTNAHHSDIASSKSLHNRGLPENPRKYFPSSHPSANCALAVLRASKSKSLGPPSTPKGLQPSPSRASPRSPVSPELPRRTHPSFPFHLDSIAGPGLNTPSADELCTEHQPCPPPRVLWGFLRKALSGPGELLP